VSNPPNDPTEALREDLHRALDRALGTLDRLRERHPPEDFERKPKEESWSARENLAHLARYEAVFLERLETILREDGPVFPRYRAESDPEWPAWRILPLDEIVRRFEAQRRDLSDRLAWLTETQLRRTGRHPVFGEMDVPAWIDFFLVHEGHHFYVATLRLAA